MHSDQLQDVDARIQAICRYGAALYEAFDNLASAEWATASELFAKLYMANRNIWNAEDAIRKGEEQSVSDAQIRLQALQVRDTNIARCKIKNAIAELFSEFDENDTKINYGRPDVGEDSQ
jgi:hypothetical protein